VCFVFVVSPVRLTSHLSLRTALERSLVVPIPLYPLEVRKAKHTEIAHSLRATQKAKLEARAHTAQKKKEAITSADKTGSLIPKKRMRSEIEAEDDTEIQGGSLSGLVQFDVQEAL
jgi:hypothetical protein